MTIKQMIKKAKMVFVWVRLSENDGAYIQVTKCNLLLVLAEHDFSDRYFNLRPLGSRDGWNDLYID